MKRTYTIGRDPSRCDIVIYDLTDVISRSHATLRVDGKHFYVTDHSTNGTYLNGIRMQPNVEYPVTKDDELLFGNIASMDWNAINVQKKNPSWLLFIVSVLAVAVISVCVAIFIPKLSKEPETDSDIELFDSLKQHQTVIADSLKTIPAPPQTPNVVLKDIIKKPSATKSTSDKESADRSKSAKTLKDANAAKKANKKDADSNISRNPHDVEEEESNYDSI